MIKGSHVTFFTKDAEALRAFFRDKLGLPTYDSGGGWLMFELPLAELGCHPIDEEDSAPAGSPGAGHLELSFYCDDLAETVAQLKRRGVEFTSGVSDEGWGLVTQFRIPGEGEIQLYQPKHERKPSP